MVRACAHSKAGIEGFCKTSESQYAPDLLLEPLHLDITVDVNIQQGCATIEVITTLRAKRPARSYLLNGVGFQNLTVESAQQINWFYDGKEIKISWADDFKAGEERTFKTSYVVERPVAGLVFSYPSEEYPDTPRFAATDHETEKARYWLACKDVPSIRTAIDWHITSDADHTALANGVRIGEEPVGEGRKRTHWKLAQRCPSYLACFAVGPFVREVGDDVDGVPIEYYGVEGTAAQDLQRSFGTTPAIMNWMVQKFGRKFPYGKYFQFAFPDQGGAMENISLTTWDDSFVCDEVWHKEFGNITEEVNVHEMAHSYHGDMLTIRHFEHAWLKESWATYTEALWSEDTRSKDDFSQIMMKYRDAYFSECEKYIRPIVSRKYDSSWDMFDRHLYPGGAWRIHMLRNIVGDDVFWISVKDYIDIHAFKCVETDDFRRVLESHSGLNLTRFFDQWLYSPGYPKVKGDFAHDTEKNTVTIKFTQEVDDKRGVSLFDFELDVEVFEENGTSQKKTVNFSSQSAHTQVTFAVTDKPVEVRVDENNKVLFSLEFNPSTDMLKRTLTHCENLILKIWAVKELSKEGTKSSFDAISQALSAEKSHYVREEAAAVLADSTSHYATELLAQLLKNETHPRAQARIAAQVVGKKHVAIERAVLGWLNKDAEEKLPYGLLSNCLQALGHQRNPEHFGRIKKMSQDKRYRVAAGAYKGLSEYHSVDSFQAIAPQLRYGALPNKIRCKIVESFADISKHIISESAGAIRHETIDILEGILSEPNARDGPTLFAALRALKKLQASESVDKIEDVRARLPAQDGPYLDRLIDAIESKDKSNASLLKKMEEYDEKLAKLEKVLQDMKK